MKIKITLKIAFLFLLLVFLMPMSYGQKKKTSSSNKNFGVGVKIGDPLGLSLKKYNGNKALELIIGQTYYWGGNYYNYYYRHDNRFKNKVGYRYGGYDSRSTPIAVQLRYLIHKDIKEVDGLQWYYGVGGQFRYQTFRYHYWDVNNVRYYERVTDYGIGPDGVLGLEYTFDGVPISLALDLNLYMEIIDRPFLFLFQGGLAARYNF